nr:hypothetical protein [Pandoravirus aubagnensis]
MASSPLVWKKNKKVIFLCGSALACWCCRVFVACTFFVSRDFPVSLKKKGRSSLAALFIGSTKMPPRKILVSCLGAMVGTMSPPKKICTNQTRKVAQPKKQTWPKARWQGGEHSSLF